MRKRLILHAITNLIMVFTLVFTSIVPVSGADILSNDTVTGDSIKAGVATLFDDDILMSDTEDMLIKGGIIGKNSSIEKDIGIVPGKDVVMEEIYEDTISDLGIEIDDSTDDFNTDDSKSVTVLKNSLESNMLLDDAEKGNVYEVSSGTYDVDSAISYAKVANYKMECNVFVAECLTRGGLNFSSGGKVAGLRNNIRNSGLFEEILIPTSCYDKKSREIRTTGDITRGDILVYMCYEEQYDSTNDSPSRPPHIALVTDIVNGKIRIADRVLSGAITEFSRKAGDYNCPENSKHSVYNGNIIVYAYHYIGDGKGNDMGEKSPFKKEIDDDDYVIMSALRYDLHLNIEGDDTSDNDYNVNVERGFGEDSKYDVFKVRRLDNGYYKLIQNKTNHMAVSVAGKSASDKANIQMYYWNPEDLANNKEFQWAIQWAKKQDGIPYHYLRARCSGLYMTATGTTNGKNVYQASHDNEDDDCQKWYFARYMKPDIETDSLPKGSVGKSYSADLEADSDFDVKWTFSGKDNNLPPGLALDKSGKITGTPTKSGTYTFSLDAENLLVDALGYSTKKYTITIDGNTPVKKLVTGITLNKSTSQLAIGASETLKPTITPADATNKTITWKSKDTKIATVDSNGKVTAVSVGSTTITASSVDGSNKSASCIVTVSKSNPEPTGIVIKVGEVLGTPGKTVSVPVSISGNTGLGGMALTIISDSNLTLTAIEKGSLLSIGTFETDVKTGLVQWYTSSKAVKGDGVLFTLKFNVKEGINKGSHPVNIALKDGLKANITDENSTILDVTLKNGSVNTELIKGDLTGDGEVAMGDVVKLARAVAGSVTLKEDEKAAADVTGDGEVAMGDVVKMARFVSGSIIEL